jgi:predicted RNase H-like nuclease (RuvC/YqgF family)
MSVTCKSLKIENDSLKDQIKALKGDFQNLEKILRGFETAADIRAAIHASTKSKSKNISNFTASHTTTLITSKMKPMPN